MEKVSIIIITYNRKDKLESLLNSLLKQTYKSFEVVVIVDGSSDGTDELLQNYQSKFDSLRFEVHQNSGRSFSRNKGAALASGNLLIFFDDDMEILPDCIYQHVHHHQVHPQSICVGTQEECEAKIVNDFDQYRYDVGQLWEQNIVAESKIIPRFYTYLTAAHFSVEQSDFMKLGGFEEKLDVGEDFDLAVRAQDLNISLYYCPKNRAFHNNVLTCMAFVKKQNEYYTGYQKLTQLKPDTLNKYSATTFYDPSILKRIIYFVVANPKMVRLIDQEFFVSVLPRKWRYFFYSIVITGISRVYPYRLKKLY